MPNKALHLIIRRIALLRAWINHNDKSVDFLENVKEELSWSQQFLEKEKHD